jgi:hypothetical protein
VFESAKAFGRAAARDSPVVIRSRMQARSAVGHRVVCKTDNVDSTHHGSDVVRETLVEVDSSKSVRCVGLAASSAVDGIDSAFGIAKHPRRERSPDRGFEERGFTQHVLQTGGHYGRIMEMKR